MTAKRQYTPEQLVRGQKYLLDDFSKDVGIFNDMVDNGNRTSIRFIPFGSHKYTAHQGLISFKKEPEIIFYK